MSDWRRLFDREAERFKPSDEALDRVIGRARMRHTLGQVATLALGIGVSIVAILIFLVALLPLGAQDVVPGIRSATPSQSVSPSSSVQPGDLFVFGRLSAGRLDVCPTGPYTKSLEADVDKVARELLAVTNGRSPHPEVGWSLMDGALRSSFGSCPDFQHSLERAPLKREWMTWTLPHAPERAPARAKALVTASCGSETAAASWEVDVFSPRQQGVSGGAAQLFFVPREDGPKLWLVY